MKIVLLFSYQSHSVYRIFKKTLEAQDHDVHWLYQTYSRTQKDQTLYKLSKFLPGGREAFLAKERSAQNQHMIDRIEELKPDLVLSYNDAGLYPDMIRKIKSMSTFAMFLADNPFYSFYKKDFLDLVLEADYVFTPDTGCKEQLSMLGIGHVHYSNLGMNPDLFFKIDKRDDLPADFKHDILYLGSLHNLDAWALKRALMLESLSDLDLSAFGNRTWTRILDAHPALKEKFTVLAKPMSHDELNQRMNCCKIYPVDAHPGILSGIHARVFDAISAGILPVAEYRSDMDIVFDKVKLPVFRTYDELRSLTQAFIVDDKGRETLIKELYDFTVENYSSDMCIKQMLEVMS
jgi:spore maturation protein CgeB